jgi:hypothetical protein
MKQATHEECSRLECDAVQTIRSVEEETKQEGGRKCELLRLKMEEESS